MNTRQDLNALVRLALAALVALEGWSPTRLSKESGVRVNIITRFIKGERQEMRSGTLDRLWPFLFGDRRPTGATWDIPSETIPDVAAG